MNMLAQSLEPDMPESILAEQVVLGSILHDNEIFHSVSSVLAPDHFYNPVHQHIYGTISSIISSGNVADPIVLKNRLSQDETLTDIGGVRYISDLTFAASSGGPARQYAEIVREAYQRRKIYGLSSDLQAQMLDPESDEVPSIVSDIMADMDLIVHDSTSGINRSQSSAELGVEFVASMESETDNRKCETGFYELDRVLGGLHGSRVYILAGRPAMGKSTVALNIIRNVAMSGVGVLFLSLEMGNSDQTPRMIGSIGAKLFGVQGFPKINDFRQEWKAGNRDKILKAKETFDDLPVEWEQGYGMSVKSIRMTVARAVRSMRKRGFDLGLIVIDHIGHVNGSRPNQSQYEKVTEVSNELIPLSKKFDAPVLALCQLSRAIEQRDDKRPRLDDLRESGHIEQDAAVVIGAYRDFYYADREAAAVTELTEELERRLMTENQIELLVLKNRFGQNNRNVELFVNLNRMFIDNKAQDYRGRNVQIGAQK